MIQARRAPLPSGTPPTSRARSAPHAPAWRGAQRGLAAPTASSADRPDSGAPLDTLAQLGQSPSRLTPAATLAKRARARYLSLPLAVSLAELRGPLEKSYRNTIYCSETLTQEKGRITGNYCGNRWCMVCNRVRTARAINRYLPVVETWRDAHMATLTVKNVGAAELPETIRGMIASFQAIKRAMLRTHRVKLRALRKLECTYNTTTREFHPHFHIVTDSGRAGDLLRTLWLERNAGVTVPEAQDVRPCTKDSLREVFKYFTKLLAKTRTAAKETRDGGASSHAIPPAALDVIFRAMRGLRVYQPAGFVCAAELPDEGADELTPEEGTAAFVRPGEEVRWRWVQGAADWVDPDTGECLTGYEPSGAFRRLVESIASPAA